MKIKVISRLNISEFRRRLNYHTKKGDPTLKGGPFAFFTIFTKMGKRFYGGFDDSQFELTLNATIFLVPYIIAGTFKSKNKSETEVTYRIKPIWFGYILNRIFPVIVLVILNFVLFNDPKTFKTETILLINIALLVFFTIPLVILSFRKKRMIKDFNKTFEIET